MCASWARTPSETPRAVASPMGSATRKIYTRALYEDPGATLDDLNEAVEMLEETTRTARRVLGGAHPLTAGIEVGLRRARAALRVLWCPRIAVFEEFCDLGW